METKDADRNQEIASSHDPREFQDRDRDRDNPRSLNGAERVERNLGSAP